MTGQAGSILTSWFVHPSAEATKDLQALLRAGYDTVDFFLHGRNCCVMREFWKDQ